MDFIFHAKDDLPHAHRGETEFRDTVDLAVEPMDSVLWTSITTRDTVPYL